ncbi:tRNA pseudouridine(38-40) synthase TruA [bacterium]|nr:tRNA pseudouridine(38-40) synthase TruA [bacterium]
MDSPGGAAAGRRTATVGRYRREPLPAGLRYESETWRAPPAALDPARQLHGHSIRPAAVVRFDCLGAEDGTLKGVKRVRLNLAYDGTDFHGWQVQPRIPTIQGELETALSSFHNAPVRVYAAGRTDAGVHAAGQVVHYDAPTPRVHSKLLRAMESMLPDAIRVTGARDVPDTFHARFRATERVYVYNLLRVRDPFMERFGLRPAVSWNPEDLAAVAQRFPGRRDWSLFATQPDPGESTICELRRVSVHSTPFGARVVVVADRFLRRMVRTLVGTMLQAASGHISASELEEMLQGRADRAGVPVAPQGLALARVRYELDTNEDKPISTVWGDIP